MDEDVLKKVCNFLQSEKEKEVFFPKFWDGTKEFYPPGMSKTKVKAWLKQHNERFEIIASEKGDPFGKVKLKVETTSSDLPATSKNQDKKITQKLIECIDNTAENGHLFAIICKNKAQIFPEKLQDKKHIRKWLTEHEDCFKMVNDANGGLFSVEVLDKARNLRKGRSLPPARSEGKMTTHENTRPRCQKQEGPSGFNLMQMADNIAQKISEKIKNEGHYISFDSLLKAKDIIYPLSDAGSLKSFLESFSSKFEIIVVEGLGQWVHLKSTDDAIGNITRFIFGNGGTVPFDELLKNAVRLIDVTVNTPKALSIWLRDNAGVYEVFPKPDNPSQPWQVKVKLAFPPRFCQNYVTHGQCEKRNCQFLHICKAFICRPQHSNEACELSHQVRDAHNKVIVDRMGALINKESDDVVLKVLSKSCFPRVCLEYMNKNGECKNGDKCHFLHICGNYVLNQCSGHCQLSHQVADGRHNIELLKRFAMLPSKNMSEEIIKINIAFAPVKKTQPDQSVGEWERFVQAAKPPHMFKSLIHDQSLEVSSREKKKQHRPRKRKSDQASSTVDDGSSAETDSTAGDFDNQSIASSTDNTKQPLLSSDNIQKSNLATSLTGHQKVESWMGSPVREPYPTEAADESCKQSDSSSDVSHPTSVASTKSSFWQGDLQKKVFITILEKYNGSAMFSRIVKERDLFSRDINIVNWFESFPQTFILHRNGQGKIDSVSAFSRKSRLCLDYSGKHGCVKPLCGFFHICRDHVQGHCRGGNTCPRNHDFNHEQVTEAAKSMGLHDLTQSQLHTLIQVSVPAVCHFHNHGRCNRGVFCPNLHICKKFVRGHCPAKACKLGHQGALKQDPAKKILNMYRLLSKQQPNVNYIRKMIFVYDTRKRSGDQTGEGRASENQSENLETTDEVRVVSGLMDIDLTEKVDNAVPETEEVAPIICSKFLLGQRHKKCRDFHFGLPYCWQFKSPSGSWDKFDKSDCENIEKYFCDVNCTATELSISTQIAGVTSSVRLDFQSMSGQTSTGDGFKVRRLECQAKEQVESEAWYLTQWKWYKLESTKWMEQANEVSLLDVIEGKIDRSSLRRRPAVFITESQVDEKKRAQQEQQSSEAPLSPTPGSPVSREPPQSSSDSVRENIPPQPEPASADCHRTRVEQGSKDYREVEKLLMDCVGQNDVVVNHIERIVSDDLWEKHKSKKKSMTDELRPGEHLNEHRLFVPCLYEDLERITRGNIHLSRIDVPKPLGPGHYFTSDASLCLEMCRENFTQSRFLIVCQVLLGTYTHASPGLTELPRRPDGRFYDSLVDKNDDPTVFVLQEKDLDQCYPAFILDFSYTPTSPQNEVDGTLRSSEGNHGLTTQPQQFYPNVSQPLPAYQPDPPRLPASTHPLSTGYAPGSTNLSSVVPQQPHMTPNIPTSPDYVKVAPPYSERPPLPSDPPPGYTPLPQSTSTVSADLHNPRNVRRTPASPTSRPPKNPKECLVM